jgi:hypothetical protein
MQKRDLGGNLEGQIWREYRGGGSNLDGGILPRIYDMEQCPTTQIFSPTTLSSRKLKEEHLPSFGMTLAIAGAQTRIMGLFATGKDHPPSLGVEHCPPILGGNFGTHPRLISIMDIVS